MTNPTVLPALRTTRIQDAALWSVAPRRHIDAGEDRFLAVSAGASSGPESLRLRLRLIVGSIIGVLVVARIQFLLSRSTREDRG